MSLRLVSSRCSLGRLEVSLSTTMETPGSNNLPCPYARRMAAM